MSDKQTEQHNNDVDQALNLLWQQQTTDTVNIEGLKNKWLKIQFKQRVYFAVDIAGVIFMLAAFYLVFDKLGLFAKTWMAVLVVFAAVIAGYISYLRRFALLWSNVVTGSYMEHLKKQLISNIRIAKLNRDLSLWMVLALVIFHVGMYYFDDLVLETVLKKGFISLVVLAIFTPPFWLWANRRAKRFTRELMQLEQILDHDRV